MKQEEWYQLSKIPIDDFKVYENYWVSNLGRIKAVRNGQEIVLKQQIRKNKSSKKKGYYRISLSPTRKAYSVHRLVALAFNFNPDYKNLTVDHINEDTLDNRIENLQWLTSKENSQKSNLGRYTKFNLQTRQKIKDAFVKEGKSYEELVCQYKCSLETIHTIVNDDRLEGVNHRKRNNFSKEKKLNICRKYRLGVSVKELSHTYNCAKTYIYKILKEEKEGILDGKF